MPALVEGERRPAASRRRRGAKSAWFSLREPAPWRITIAGPGRRRRRGQPEHVRAALVDAALARRLGRAQAHRSTLRRAHAPADVSGAATSPCASECAPWPSSTVADPIAGSPVYPLGSRVNERGHLEVGGCDVVELAARVRHARLRLRRGRHPRPRRAPTSTPSAPRTDDFEVLYASKAAPITAIYRLLRREGLSVDVASGGELHMALARRLRPGADLHARQQQDRGRAALRGRGRRRPPDRRLVRRDRARSTRLLDRAPGRADPGHPRDQGRRPTPTSRPGSSTRSSASGSRTGSPRARDRRGARRPTPASWSACTPTSARRSSSSSPTRRRSRRSPSSPTATGCRILNVGGGLGIAYTADDEPPSIDELRRGQGRAASQRVFDPVPRILIEPGRSLVGNAGVTALQVGTVKEIPGRPHLRRGRRRHVRQPAADALRLALRGADRQPRRRARPRPPATVAGMHCESGDILVRDAMLAAPAARRRPRHPGDRRLRLRDGEQLQRRARGRRWSSAATATRGVVVRRETYDDLLARDVE